EASEAALHEARRALAAGHLVVRIAAREPGMLVRITRHDLGCGQAFEDSESPLPQPRIRDDVPPRMLGDRLRRVPRAREIAAVERAEAVLREPPAERLGLGAPQRGQRR